MQPSSQALLRKPYGGNSPTLSPTRAWLFRQRAAAAAMLPQLMAMALSWMPTHADAQVGLTEWQSQALARPVTLVYPTKMNAGTRSFGSFELQVAVNALPSPGRHHLIVMSHGTAGSPLPDHALAARLAKAGFVVAQLLHDGDNYLDQRLAGPESFRLRPIEAMRLLDALAADPSWRDRLDLSRVGVHGMSAGGVTALALAGAQWRTLNLVRHCLSNPVDDEAFCFQGARTAEKRAERQARFDRARFWPDAVLPAELKTWHGGRTDPDDPRPDSRIVSVTAAVPVAAIFSVESLENIRVPVGLVSARMDQVLVPRFHSGHVIRHCKTCELLADLPAGHFDVLWPWPEEVAKAVASQQWRGGEPTPGFDAALRDQAHALIVEFHRRQLLR